MQEDLIKINYKIFREAFTTQLESIKKNRVKYIHKAIHRPLRDKNSQKSYLDMVYLGPRDAKKALVLIAGTSGVDGYTGSMILHFVIEKGVVGFVDEDTAILRYS